MDTGEQGETKSIAIVTALEAELRPIAKRLGLTRIKKTRYAGQAKGRQVVAIASGMGEKQVVQGLDALYKSDKFGTLIQAGFAGALSPSLMIGDVINAQFVCNQTNDIAKLSDQPPVVETCEQASSDAIRAASTILTVGKAALSSEEKQKLLEQHCACAVDMETFAAAQWCATNHISMTAIRTISDLADQSLPEQVSNWINTDGTANIWAATFNAICKPSLIPEMLKLSRHAKVAGETLAVAVERSIAESNG